ncbi:hypothetical protein PoB_006870000 [Plakobranchus ocellatus]|uniref:PiggyBac transposable element-derived protein domain-containing protein n=1 Tax=Plakobranchus ocellatus TaxID=259542 RepID=A0AAV4DE38_9GAST|nr:hypothetical protein PoB_006870000 [Plakobranchus ocellatus]
MILGYKKRWQYKQFNASKPDKYHIKSFALVDSSCGYVILTYYGKNTSYHPDSDPDSGMAIRIFDTLLKDVGTRYHIFADRWYYHLCPCIPLDIETAVLHWHRAHQSQRFSEGPQDTKVNTHGGKIF